MPGPSFLPETPAHLFERPRAGASAATYWKCRIGRRIHLAREEAQGRNAGGSGRLTREKLAQRLGLPPRRLWEIENGLLGVEAAEIAMIAEALGVHPGYFFDQGPWSNWTGNDGTRPGGALAKTIGEMGDASRAALESLALYLVARQARGAYRGDA
jgi:transcriptional regulator with XRE-family HTH domain